MLFLISAHRQHTQGKPQGRREQGLDSCTKYLPASPIWRRSSLMPGAGSANGSHDHPGPQRGRKQPEGALTGLGTNFADAARIGVAAVYVSVKQRNPGTARRRHHAQVEGVIDDFATSPRAWMPSRARRQSTATR